MVQTGLTGVHGIVTALSWAEPEEFPTEELALLAARCVRASFAKFKG
jgi:hypothetical protein